MKPVYVEIEKLSVCAIAGITGSGKSSTARFLITQLLLDNTHVIVCDPHGLVGNESLAGALEPLHDYITIATSKEEIIKQFRHLSTLFELRMHGADKQPRIALFLDETPAFFLSCSREEMKDIGTLLVNLTNQARKVNIRVFLLGQNWKADYIGARAIRSSINTIIFHRISEYEVRLFIESAPAQLRRRIANLDQGHVILYGIGLEPTLLRVPYVDLDDIRNVQKTLVAQNFARTEVHHSNAVNSDFAPLHDTLLESLLVTESTERANVQTEIKIEKARNITHAVQMIEYAIQHDLNKEEVLKTIFDTYKSGRNKKWLAASKLYENIRGRRRH